MCDEEKLKKAIDQITIIAELMMAADCQRPSEFSPGIINRIGVELSEAVEKIEDEIKNF